MALDAVTANHALFLRALTSRLGEVKDISLAWRAVEAPPDGAYLRALRLVRDACHEWTAADVLRAAGTLGGGGVPAWSWPAYPRAPWASLLCPVVASLLCSPYEDWLLPATDATGAMIAATAHLIEAASACSEDDLWPPASDDGVEGDAGGDDEDAHMRHAAATSAVAFVRHATPLLPALTCAAQCASPTVRRAAAQHSKALRGAIASIAHLSVAASAASAGGGGGGDASVAQP